jgi:hypothetical protein
MPTPTLPDLRNERAIIITREGLFRQEPPKFTYLGTQDMVLKECAKDFGVTLNNVLGDGTLLRATRESFCSAARLKAIRLNTQFIVITPTGGTACMVPSFRAQGGSVGADLTWVVPSDLAVYFMMFGKPMPKADSSGRILQPDKSYLVAIDKDGRMYRLPLPNIYDDASVCLGGVDLPRNSIAAYMAAGMKAFTENPWNADLLGNDNNTRITKAQALFQFEPDGKQRAVTGYKAQLIPVSSSRFDFLKETV